jgi:pimeloyl-ACP methyl ester carboxylesterase
MPQVELSQAKLEYEDTGGDGPVLVLTHGLTMDGTLWRNVLPSLTPHYRCITPTLPLGGHRIAVPEADLTLRGVVHLLADFLDALDLHDVTLVLNDWGGGQLLVSEGRDQRLGRLVLVACEAFDNYPPGIGARLIRASTHVPGALWLLLQGLRLEPLRRAPASWGWLSKRPVPHEVMTSWFAPATTRPEIRRDLARYARQRYDPAELLRWSERLRSFPGPVLVVWATEDKLMPREHGRRLVELFPNARLVEIEDSYTLIPEDQPDRLAEVMLDFLAQTQPVRKLVE